MLKNLVRLEHMVQDKVIHMYCDHDTSTTAIKEALCQFMKYVGMIEDQVKATLEASMGAESTPQSVPSDQIETPLNESPQEV